MTEACLDAKLATLADEELLGLLATEADRLTRDAVDELVRRAERMIAPLAAICSDDAAWDGEDETLAWKPIHATFILGAIGGERAIDGLLAALRHATARESEWASEVLPAIFGRIGRPALGRLQDLIGDREADADARIGAIEALAAVAARSIEERETVLDFVREIVGDKSEDSEVRGFAGMTLLDFARPQDRAILLAEARRQRSSAGTCFFDRSDVERENARAEPDLQSYLHDWLEFYDAREISARQARRAREEEAERWSRGVEDEEPWVSEECDRAIERYEASLAALDERSRDRALWIASSMFGYLVRREHRPPWDWDEWTVREYLGYFVRKVSCELDDKSPSVPANVMRFVRFWEAEGKVEHEQAEGIEALLREEQGDFVRRARDPHSWDMAKSLVMRMRRDGVDLEDQEAVDAWLAEYNASRLPPPRPEPVRRAKKVGRNEPCPCGSGTKYKKCCGGRA